MALSKIDISKMTTGTTPVTQGGTGITSGTTDQFLKFTGTTTLASSADNSGLTLITSSTTTGGSISLTDVFTSTYRNYLMTFDNINFVNDTQLGCYFIESGGGLNTTFQYSYAGYKDGTTGLEGSNGSTGYLQPHFINSIETGAGTTEGMTGYMNIFAPQLTSGTYAIAVTGARNGADNAWAMNTIWWAKQATTAFTGIKLEGVSGGNFNAGGRIQLYGILSS